MKKKRTLPLVWTQYRLPISLLMISYTVCWVLAWLIDTRTASVLEECLFSHVYNPKRTSVMVGANSTAASCTHNIVSRDEGEKGRGAYSSRIRWYHSRGYTRSGGRTHVFHCLEIEEGAFLTAEYVCGWEAVLKGELQEERRSEGGKRTCMPRWGGLCGGRVVP